MANRESEEGNKKKQKNEENKGRKRKKQKTESKSPVKQNKIGTIQIVDEVGTVAIQRFLRRVCMN